jgi:transmembrane sensor
MDEAVLGEAVAWHERLKQEDADWDAYTLWLEADPRHREAYNSLDLIFAAVGDHRDEIRRVLRPAAPETRPRGRWARSIGYMGGGIAAAVALFLAVPVLWAPEPVRSYQADGQQSRVVALADGIEVTLSPASRIVVHGKDGGRIELASGEAFFDVRHNPERTLSVSAGRYSIADIGTRFSVNLTNDIFRVGVSEGTVAVSSESIPKEIHVAAGQQLLSATDGLTLSPVAIADVASWRAGRLSYSNAPLPLVAADISRYSGRSVSIDPSLEKMHFSGSLVIGDGSRLLSELATVMGADIRREQGGDRIGPAAR